MDYAQIKADNPIRSVAYRLIGDRLKKENHSYDLYLCPFHQDSNPSFVVNETQCTCYAGCAINGRLYGDVFDFVQELYGFPHSRDAAVFLSAQPAEISRRELPIEDKPSYRLGWRDVWRGTEHQKLALPYFHQRGLTDSTVRSYQLGKYVEWKYYRTIAGVRHTFSAPRYSIPDIAFGTVRNIELRLDEQEAVRRLALVAPDLRRAAEIEAGTDSARELSHFFYGPRYLRVPGGRRENLLFNADLVVQRIQYDGGWGWFSREIPQLLVHEGALKALAMQDAGYPSISCKGAPGLGSLFGVKEIIIVQDNDEDVIRNGKTFNAGVSYASKALEMTGRTLGNGVRIISPPPEFKAADDVVLAGCVDDWMRQHGIKKSA